MPLSTHGGASLELGRESKKKGGGRVKQNPTAMENMQESLVASAAGNATAGRELRGLAPHRRSLFSDQTALGNSSLGGRMRSEVREPGVS